MSKGKRKQGEAALADNLGFVFKFITQGKFEAAIIFQRNAELIADVLAGHTGFLELNDYGDAVIRV